MQLCADGVSSTHIAFLGTAMLAKAVNSRADLFAIKPCPYRKYDGLRIRHDSEICAMISLDDQDPESFAVGPWTTVEVTCPG